MNTYTYNGHIYFLTDQNLSWEQAENVAKSFGGHLVTINNQEEQDWLSTTFAKPSVENPTENYKVLGWIGYTDKDSEGTWKWVSGETSTYTNWDTGEPNNSGGNEDFAQLYERFWHNGKWNDININNDPNGLTKGIVELVNAAPTLAVPAVINYTDTAFDDTFATVTGVLVGKDVDKDSLKYGIAGGTAHADGTVHLSNDYGELIVTQATGEYSFVPNDNAIEALTADKKVNFVVTVSDVLQTTSQTLVLHTVEQTLTIHISQQGITESRGDEVLKGTNGDDRFDGLQGNDIIYGLAGNDFINGGIGADTMIGGTGNDVYYVENPGDVVKESSNDSHHDHDDEHHHNDHDEKHHHGNDKHHDDCDDKHSSNDGGIDTVYTIVSYRLPDNVENMTLLGDEKINGTGNELDNVLDGNGANNILRGNKGNDTLIGRDGADTLIGGRGGDDYDLTETTPANDTVRIAKGDSLVSSYDTVTNFKLGSNTVSTEGIDKLDLDSNRIANDVAAANGHNAGIIHSHSIQDGIITFDDINNYHNPLTLTAANLTDAFAYLQANIKGNNSVAFICENNTFVFQDGGANDTLVELVGVTAQSLNNSGLANGAVWLV